MHGPHLPRGFRPVIALLLPVAALCSVLASCAALGSTYTVFGDRAPSTPVATDPLAVELGMKFTPSTDGIVFGVRFYKGVGNTGTHTGSLWTLAGERLTTGTFRNETNGGWQSLDFETPFGVHAGVTYLVSYFAPAGHYSADPWFFSDGPTVAGPLTAPKDGTSGSGANSMFKYGPSGFPNGSFHSMNYWVDVNFRNGTTASSPSSTAPPTTKPANNGSTTTTQAPTTTKAPTTTTTQAPTTTKAPTTTTTAPTTPGNVPSSFPNASNTGVPVGTQLTSTGGYTHIDANYAKSLPGSGTAADPYVFANKYVPGRLQIDVAYITIKNSRVIGDQYYGIWAASDHVTVMDSEVGPTGTDDVDNGIFLNNYSTALRVNVHNGTANMAVRNNVLIQDSYLHDQYEGPEDHTDGILCNGGNNGVIRHNTIIGNVVNNPSLRAHNGVILINNYQLSSNWLVEQNYMDHNGFHIYADVQAPFTIRNNVLTDDYERTPNKKWYVFSVDPFTSSGNVNGSGTPLSL